MKAWATAPDSAPMIDGELVFVYGTLRRGGSNAHRMGESEHIGPARVTGKLYRISWYPALVIDPNAGAVLGDLWSVPSAALAALDEYEGSEYQRVKTKIHCIETDQLVDASVWVWKDPGSLNETALVESGDWLMVQE